MTLKEKFENIIFDYIGSEWNRRDVCINLETDADEFAIGFAYWLQENNGAGTYEELLKEFKKEKGL